MAGRERYSAEQQARLFVALTANDGNIKRTARETGVPESTVRRFRDNWQTQGPPPIEEVQAAAKDILTRTAEVRDNALEEIDRQIKAGEMKGAALVTAYGVMTDKIDRARGLANARVEHVHSLPSPEALRELMQAAVEGARQGALARAEEIIDAEIVEQTHVALPSPRH